MKLTTHPNNLEWLKKHLREEKQAEQRPRLWNCWSISPDPLWGIEIVTNVNVPERKVRVDWYPPDEDQFASYGPEDEEWMRPLGLGRFVSIDEGPLFYVLPTRFFMNDLSWNILTLEPRGIIHSITC